MNLRKTDISTAFGILFLLLSGCSQPYTVSINNQAVYDPSGRLIDGSTIDADLQGCINLALRQQSLSSPTELTVLSCANSAIRSLENIGQLSQLRFLDLSNNNITNITPLEDLPTLGGLSLINNQITDIAPLFNLPGLTSVSLLGNDGIPCQQIQALRSRLGANLNAPESCRN
ncbi:MAG: leucine-rich repeat domain-containing protein [Pseudomonadales bacterium]|nr:leucine-rich repeat domain-containing protein [Pseudomonadales bacterium]